MGVLDKLKGSSKVELQGLDDINDLPSYSLIKTAGLETDGKYYFLESESVFPLNKDVKPGLVEIHKDILSQTTLIINGESKAFVVTVDGYITSVANLLAMGATMIKCNKEQ